MDATQDPKYANEKTTADVSRDPQVVAVRPENALEQIEAWLVKHGFNYTWPKTDTE
jgi:hypothetical protein